MLACSHTGMTVMEIAEHLECKTRTVYRDLEVLQGAHFPVYCERINGRNVWRVLDRLENRGWGWAVKRREEYCAGM